MPTETDYLKSIAEEIVNRKDMERPQPDLHLKTEAKRLEKAVIRHLSAIGNYSQREIFYFNTLSKLVHIADILFESAGAADANVTLVTELLEAIRQAIPDGPRPDLQLPKAFVESQKENFRKAWEQHRRILQSHQTDHSLINIAAIPFIRFAEPKEVLCWGDLNWLRSYQAKLDLMDWENIDCSSPTEALISLLIGRDFNDDRFFIYCKKYILARVNVVSGKRLRLLEYAECEKLVLHDTQVGMASFDLRANTVSTRLLKWIGEEIDFVETHEKETPGTKLNFQLFKYTLAFFFKLLHEQKVFGDISFRELAQQIAGSCTAMGEDIPADSVIKKAYLKKQVDFERMETLLVAMLEYLRRFMK